MWLLVALLPYPWLPESVQTLLYLCTSCGTVVALLAGLRMFRPVAPAPWYLLSAAFSSFLIGDYLTSFRLDADGVPIGPWSDLAYLAFYPLALSALVLLIRRGVDRDVSAWLDAVIWGVGASVLAWKLLFDDSAPVVTTTFAGLIAAAYPVMDLVLFLVLLRLVFVATQVSFALLLVGVGLGAQLLTDVAYLGDLVGGAYVAGGPLDVGWLLSYTAVAIAALHPSMAESAVLRVRPPEGQLAVWRIPLLLVPALTAPTMLGLLLVADPSSVQVEDVAVATAATFLVLVLAAARGSGLVNLANRRANDLQVRVDHDTLTGLVSRDGFAERLAAVVDEPPAGPPAWAVVFLDLDDFKTVNDIQGHEAGDLLLVDVAVRLRAAAPGDAVVARFGGDEFALLLRCTDVESFVDRLLASMERPLVVGGSDLSVGVSIGSATATRGTSAAELMRCVDVAMYDAKRSGHSWSPYVPEMSQSLLAARDTRDRLVQGIAAGEVVPWFQPVVDLGTGGLAGFEALARWVTPDHVLVVPTDQWLALAEESDLIVEVDRRVLRAAVAQLALWRRSVGSGGLTMAVYLSARTLHQVGIAEEVLDVLRRAAVPADRLVVEVTEGVQIQDDEVANRLQRLRAHGVRIALDDFGTGWSSLSYLRRFPVDLLKLDRSFTNELGSHADASAIPAAVVQLARTLGLGVVAEGVETASQRAALLDLGFDLCQGHLYARALPGAALGPWVGEGSDDAGAGQSAQRARLPALAPGPGSLPPFV